MNWDRVHELRSEVGADAFEEVVALFLEETDGVAERLAAAPDPETLGSELHFMKGAALNLGFDDLATVCSNAESALRTGGAATVDVAHVLAAYARSKVEIQNGDTQRMAG
ncbi:Hpt domain-containing protein [Meridianimarinicoccus aquatilis]|uniref:Hpt domain-containing protein n=1 Tax=Meridianimarinicoccus aquatilis TaxID=2552766 RepID=A0A4R6AXT9_9RHOB|nr:Hpt domain-containing protein [Fluviibacterium aquatile]QIE40787.1 Hpt domain-containing protein [Rhodobacteraceae bacterium SC52]TDL89100.1 Hpt domain-containing protein [Fluviibacterium aquatile]